MNEPQATVRLVLNLLLDRGGKERRFRRPQPEMASRCIVGRLAQQIARNSDESLTESQLD